MKVGRLIELLKKVSPDAEVMYKFTTDDYTYQSNITILELEGLETYNRHNVLKKRGDEKYCILSIKKNPYQYNPKRVRN